MSVTGSEAKSWAREVVRGLWTSPMIPMTASGDIDHDGIRKGVEYMIDSKVDGLGFGFSELWYLSINERREAFKTFIDAVAGRVPAYLHALDYSIPETVALANYAKELGADAVMWWVPIEFARSDDAAVQWFETVAPQVDMPVFAYNTYHSGRSFTPSTIERIAAIQNICAVKDAVNDFAHAVELLDRVGDQVVVSNPLEEYLPSMLINTKQQVLLGATSVFLMQSPACQPIRDYVQAIAAGDEADAWKQYYALKPLRDIWTDVYRVLWVKEAASHPIPTIKAWMDLEGMVGGAVRAPMHNLTDAERAAFAGRLEDSGWADKLYPDRRWGK